MLSDLFDCCLILIILNKLEHMLLKMAIDNSFLYYSAVLQYILVLVSLFQKS